MLLVLRIITIIVNTASLIASAVLIIAAAIEKPKPDTDGVWLGVALALFFLANFYLLYRSYKKKHTPTTWVAFLFAVLPGLTILLITLLA